MSSNRNQALNPTIKPAELWWAKSIREIGLFFGVHTRTIDNAKWKTDKTPRGYNLSEMAQLRHAAFVSQFQQSLQGEEEADKDGPVSINEYKRRKEAALWRKEDLSNLARMGLLVRRDEVVDDLGARLAALRQQLVALPDEVAQAVAGNASEKAQAKAIVEERVAAMMRQTLAIEESMEASA